MSDRDDDAFGDAVYEAWRCGRNPDMVDPDRISYDRAIGYDHDECVSRELRRLQRTTDSDEYAREADMPQEGEHDECRHPCPACPDGNEWDSNGPTGRACPTCKGKAYV